MTVADARQRQPAPGRPGRGGALVDKDRLRHRDPAAVRENQLLLVPCELEVVLLEAGFGERLVCRAVAHFGLARHAHAHRNPERDRAYQSR